MKKTTATILLIISLLYSCEPKKKEETNTQKKEEVKTETKQKVESEISETDANEKLLTEIRKDKIVVEAIITTANVLYVSVVDDGNRRDDFAEYLCQYLKKNNSKVGWVKITKAGSTNDPNRDNAYGVLLGESYCK